MKSYKIVVLGSGGVGKSAITVQFVSGYFVERYDPTIEDFYRKIIHIGDDDIELEILDTAGTEQFASMRDLYIKNGDGFLLVYSIVNGDTFEHIQVLRQQILRMRDENVPIVIVGNKCDRKDERIVSYEDGVILSKEWRCPFRETSAKTTQNVLDVFAEIAKEIGSGPDSQNTCKPTCCSVQ